MIFYDLGVFGSGKRFPRTDKHSTIQEKERKKTDHTSKGMEQDAVKNPNKSRTYYLSNQKV